MTAPQIDRLVCGCIPGVDHWDGCVLGDAEQVAVDAAYHFPAIPGVRSRLVVALVALEQAGLLHDPELDDLGEDVVALLDTLWEMGLIERADAGTVAA